MNFPEGTDIYEAQAALAKCDCVVNASVFADFRERIANMMSSLNYVVLLIIASAAALAFVVLYNLTNINIMERIREIATIKVLGFYRRETSDYVFRENMILTLIGMLTGLGLGVLLHSFVIDQIVVDLVYTLLSSARNSIPPRPMQKPARIADTRIFKDFNLRYTSSFASISFQRSSVLPLLIPKMTIITPIRTRTTIAPTLPSTPKFTL